jgi:hypothetical protein
MTSVEKASRKLGIVVFKAMATNPDVADADDEVVDEESAEEAFWNFMLNPPEEPVDYDHKEALKGKIVAGWYFPDEHVFRFAFKPDDPEVVQKALDGDLTGSSFYASLREPSL